MVSEGSAYSQVVRRRIAEDSVSLNTTGLKKMTYDEQNLDLDPTIIILGLGYACTLLLAIGWVASF